jgi:hypothetical protein
MDGALKRLGGILALAASLPACRTTSSSGPTYEERAQFGDVAVDVDRAPRAPIDRPTTGWLAGLGVGTVRGLGATVAFAGYGAAMAGGGTRVEGGGRGGDGFMAVVIIFGAAVGAAVGVLYTPVSMISGATSAPSGNDVEWADTVIRPLAESDALADLFAAKFAESARSVAGRGLVPLDAATSVVELRIDSIDSGKTWDWITLNRPFEIVVQASARVFRVKDSRLIWETRARTPEKGETANQHTYVEWATDQGEPLRRELDDALSRLANRFARAVFVDPDAGP